MVSYRDTITLKLYNRFWNNGEIQATVIGKVNGADAYVILISGMLESEEKHLKNRYGYPIRQLKLEWGKFFGTSNEFIVSKDDIVNVIKV